jgi:selenide, water dikinase
MDESGPRIHSEPFRLTDRARAAGCAGKLGPAELSRVLGTLPVTSHPDLLVGTATADDAGVFRLSPDVALVQTVDFFTPIVDDPFRFGGVAAANALSDVYAMGGEPRTALNVACFPQRGVPMAVLGEILRGGIAKAAEAGVVVLGGHTVIDEEIKFGMAVTGVVHPERFWRNVGARPGDTLVLTKALGTGIVTTARKHGMGTEVEEQAAIESMLALNAAASRILREFGVHACTDVTGFSLLGHGFEMAHGSGARIELIAARLPALPGARALASAGQLTGGCRRNREWLADRVEIAADVPTDLVEIAYDPQTSGGLLAALPASTADAAVTALRAGGVTCATIVGAVHERHAGPWIALR